ncbi:MAG: hypothetical protein ACLPN5_18100, partial [Roseiarcus sp.]
MTQVRFRDPPSTGLSFGAAARRGGGRASVVKGRLSLTLRTFAPVLFGYVAALADAVVIFASAYIANVAYTLTALGYVPQFETIALIGFAVALMVVGSGVQRGEYDLQAYLRKSGQMARA